MDRISRENAGAASPLVDENGALEVSPSYLPSDKLSLEIGLYASDRITADQLADFKVFIKRLEDNQPSPYVAKWSDAVAEGVSSVSRILRDPTDYGQTMRSIISFRPFVGRDRLAALRQSFAKKAEAPIHSSREV
jgi:hypothetical protein